MNTLIVNLPDSLHSQLKKLAAQEGLSVDQLAVAALSEKIAALMSVDYLSERAKRGNRKSFEKAMQNVPNVEPDQFDTL